MLRAEGRVLKGEGWGSEKEAAWSKDFFFIQVQTEQSAQYTKCLACVFTTLVKAADTQLGLMYNFGTDGSDGTPYPDSQWDSEVVQTSILPFWLL